MKDAVSIHRIELLHPKVRQTFKDFITEAEYEQDTTFRVVQGLRTFAEQDELYSHGRTKLFDEHGRRLGIVTMAKAGSSYHNYGLAVDLVEMVNGLANWNFIYKKILHTAQKYDIFWGGLFHSIIDKPHFEKHFGISWQELRERHDKKQFIPGTEYVLI